VADGRVAVTVVEDTTVTEVKSPSVEEMFIPERKFLPVIVTVTAPMPEVGVIEVNTGHVASVGEY